MKTHPNKSLNSLSFAIGLLVISGLFSTSLSAQTPFNCTIGLGFTSGGIIKAEPHPQGGFLALGYGNTYDQGSKTILIRISEEGDT